MTLWWFDFKTWLTGSYRGTPRERWGYWKYRAQVALGLRDPIKWEDWKFETETELEGWHSEEVEDELVEHFKKTGLLEAELDRLAIEGSPEQHREELKRPHWRADGGP